MRLSLLPLLFALTLISTSPAAAGWNPFRSCSWLLQGKVNFVEDEDGYVNANDVAVTGEDLYPTPLILKNLDIGDSMIKAMARKKLLSVGEGFSGLIPYLRGEGILAEGLDLWYSSKKIPTYYVGRKMREYIEKHKAYLISGSAFAIPAKAKSYDFVVSHMLVNNFNFKKSIPFLKEAIRITRPGGEIRIYGYDERVKDRITETLGEFKDQISYTTELREFEYHPNGFHHVRSDLLLVIRILSAQNL